MGLFSAFKKTAEPASADLEGLWKKLQTATNCKSLLKKHLTPDVYDQLKGLKTKYGGTLADCIRSGKVYRLSLSGLSRAVGVRIVVECG